MTTTAQPGHTGLLTNPFPLSRKTGRAALYFKELNHVVAESDSGNRCGLLRRHGRVERDL